MAALGLGTAGAGGRGGRGMEAFPQIKKGPVRFPSNTCVNSPFSQIDYINIPSYLSHLQRVSGGVEIVVYLL